MKGLRRAEDGTKRVLEPKKPLEAQGCNNIPGSIQYRFLKRADTIFGRRFIDLISEKSLKVVPIRGAKISNDVIRLDVIKIINYDDRGLRSNIPIFL